MECPTESPKPKITWKTVLFPIIGLAAFFAYIYIFQVDILGIIATAQRADPVPYAIAVALSLVEVFFFSVSWRVLANFLKIKLSVVRSYLFVWYGIFIDTIIPAESISGEALRVYLITKEQGDQTCGRAVASLVAHRLLGMGMNVAVLIAGMVLLFTETQVDPLIFNLILFLAVGITLTLLFIMLFSFKEQWSLKVIDWLVRAGKFITRGKWHLQLTKIKEDACRIASSFHDSMKEFRRSPKALGSSLFYLALTWVFSLSVPYLVFMSLRFPVSWSVINFSHSLSRQIYTFRGSFRSWSSRNNHDHPLYLTFNTNIGTSNRRGLKCHGNHPDKTHNALVPFLNRVFGAAVA
jgi:uncharacterized protein (TIRG00374 family)